MEYIRELAASMAKAADSNRYDDFDALSVMMAKARRQVRERLEELTAGPITVIIAKLEKEQPLTDEEKKFVRMWIVGDAESYAQAENNYQGWSQELGRLLQAVQGYAAGPESTENLLALEGILEDANRVAAAMGYYLEDKERISRFEAAINQLSSEDCRIMAGILKGKLTSTEI